MSELLILQFFFQKKFLILCCFNAGQKFAMMELKVVLTWLLRSFKISTSVKEEDFQPIIEVVLRPKNGVRVYLEERN